MECQTTPFCSAAPHTFGSLLRPILPFQWFPRNTPSLVWAWHQHKSTWNKVRLQLGLRSVLWICCRCSLYPAHPSYAALMIRNHEIAVMIWLGWRRDCVPKTAQLWELPGLVSPLAFVCRWRWNLKNSKAWFSKPVNKSYSCLLPGPSTCPRRMAEVTGPSFVTFVICFFPPMALLPLSNQGDVSCLCSQPFILREWWLSSNSIKIESLEPAPN